MVSWPNWLTGDLACCEGVGRAAIDLRLGDRPVRCPSTSLSFQPYVAAAVSVVSSSVTFVSAPKTGAALVGTTSIYTVAVLVPP